ncbi:MAG: 2-hydroxyacyl-CoA dehydratase [Polyangia bacterium]|jgi:predicted CoA-substrate-specific enzyme activase
MSVAGVIGALERPLRASRPVLGLDLGSRASKGVLLAGDNLYTALVPTGLYMQETADALVRKLLRQAKLKRKAVGHVVGTGYGRISLEFSDLPYSVVTEISCHAMGAHALIPEARTVLDIGGQDSKAIKIDRETGKVVEFVMNDKCAAGTGRFLEKAAALLGIKLQSLGTVALQAKAPALVSSQCVVFAESEMISLRARGERANDADSRANIAAGVHLSAARRVTNLLGRIGLEPALVFTGGVSNNRGMWRTLEDLLQTKFVTRPGIDMIFAGAVGAAVYAAKELEETAKAARRETTTKAAYLQQAYDLIEKEEQAFIESKATKKVGFLCAYTPMELLNAAGVGYVRLMKAGDPMMVGAGELHTQSVLCDHTKSCVGGFVAQHPLFRTLDKVYSPHACGNMKRASEIIEQFVPIKLINVPKNRAEPASRRYFRDEIVDFKRDLEALTGRAIRDDEVSGQIALYNQARKLLRQISELRKREWPALSGREFLDLVRGLYYLPPEKLIGAYSEVYERSRLAPAGDGEPKLRLMVSGSIMADGDRRLLDLVEGELGGAVVVEDHCAGLRPVYHAIAETGDPYQALAEGYLDQAPCSNRRPMSDAVEFSSRLAREYDVDGVLYVYLKFCSCYGLTKRDFIEGFQAQGFPVLDVSSDYSQSDHGQLKTRLEAFVEVLRERRKSRPSVVGHKSIRGGLGKNIARASVVTP